MLNWHCVITHFISKAEPLTKEEVKLHVNMAKKIIKSNQFHGNIQLPDIYSPKNYQVTSNF